MPASFARFLRLGCLALAWLLSLPGAAQNLQPVPALSARVIDTTQTLDTAQREALEARLAAFERDKGTQIAVLLVPTTQPEDIAAYANRVANEWKIGRREIGDGLLILVAKNDRRMRIEVAKSLEGAVPDLAARQIIDEAMAPRFRQGDFAGGLDAALTRLQERIGAEILPAPGTSKAVAAAQDSVETVGTLVVMALFAGLFISMFTRAFFGRKLGSLVAGGAAAALATQMVDPVWLAAFAGLGAFVLALLTGGRRAVPVGRGLGRSAGRHTRGSNAGWGGLGGSSWGGWSSGSSGGGDGGGFSSGGGGDFGGGGASGDW